MTTKQAEEVRAMLVRWLARSSVEENLKADLGLGYKVSLSSVGGRSEIGTLRVEGPDGTVDYFHLSAVRSKS